MISGSAIAPRTAASISAAAASSDSPGKSLRISDSVQRSGTAMKPPPEIPVMRRKPRPTSGARRVRRSRPNAVHNAAITAWPARSASLPSSGHAEIGRLAGDRDVGDEEADLRRIDRRAASARHRRRSPARRPRPSRSGRRKSLTPAETPVPGWPLSSSPTKAKDTSPASRMPALSSKLERGERSADAGLQVAGAATPDLPVDDRRAEWVFPLGAGPVLAPAIDVHGVGVADEQQSLAAARALSARPRRSAGPAGIRRCGRRQARAARMRSSRKETKFASLPVMLSRPMAPRSSASASSRSRAARRRSARRCRSLRRLPHCSPSARAAAKCGCRERRRRTACCADGRGRSPPRRSAPHADRARSARRATG